MPGLTLNTPILGARAYSERFGSLARNLASADAVAGRGEETFITAFKCGHLSGAETHQRRFLHEEGLPIESHVGTHFAIRGQGFAFVKDTTNSSSVNFCRDSTFAPDANFNLVNNLGQYLQGFLTDTWGSISGSINANTLQTINVGNLQLAPSVTRNINAHAQLSAASTAGTTFNQQVAVYSPLGAQETLNFTWTRDSASTTFSTNSAVQSWNLKISGSSSIVNAPYYPEGIRVEFNASGQPVSFVTTGTSFSIQTPAINISWSNSFANASTISTTINLSLGGIEKNNGVINVGQLSDGYVTGDGYGPGVFERLDFDEYGYGRVTYSNDQTLPYCRIPLAIFNNADGLSEISPGVFREKIETSGPYRMGFPNTQAFGSLVGGFYEGSTTDQSEDYFKMIENQKDYVMNLKSLEVAKTMLAKLENI